MTTFIGIDCLTTGFINKLKTGSLAYLTRHQTWMLGAKIGDDPVLLSLTGARGFTVYDPAAYGGDAVLIVPEWRIEAGAPPYLNGAHEAAIGHAFRSQSGYGFYAAWADEGMVRPPLSFLAHGNYAAPRRGEAIVTMPHWRIVVGPADAPVVIAEFGADVLA